MRILIPALGHIEMVCGFRDLTVEQSDLKQPQVHLIGESKQDPLRQRAHFANKKEPTQKDSNLCSRTTS